MTTTTIKELIIIHINYRDVANAPATVNELQSWIGNTDTEHLENALHELLAEGVVETHDQLNYWVAGRSEIARQQASKKVVYRSGLKSPERIIKYLSWISFVLFMGIAGAITVSNATIQKEGRTHMFSIHQSDKNGQNYAHYSKIAQASSASPDKD